MNDLDSRLEHLKHRIKSAYDGIGHSNGRPYIYFVYPPEQERELQNKVRFELQDDEAITFHHLDVLSIILESTSGQEYRREELLSKSLTASEGKRALLRFWTRRVGKRITEVLAERPTSAKPVVVLRGLAALHPLGSPTGMMEELADDEPRDPITRKIVPIVLLVPGTRPPQTSRTYYFLGQEELRNEFYRGEEL